MGLGRWLGRRVESRWKALAALAVVPLALDAGWHLATRTRPSRHDLLHLAVGLAAFAGVGLLAVARRRQAQESYESLLDVLQEGVWAVDAQGRTTFVNAKLTEMLGYSAEEMQGRPVFEFLDPPDRLRVEQQLQRRREGLRDEYQIDYLRRDGGRLTALVRSAPLLENGVYRGALAAVSDVTRQRAAVLEEAAARQRLEATLDALPDLMFELDAQGVILDYRAPHVEQLYRSPREFLGRRMAEVLPEPAAARIEAGLARALERGHEYGIVYPLDMPGGVKWFELSVARRDGPTGVRLVALVREITSLVRANEELRDSQRVAGVGTYDLDLATGRWSCSPVLEEIFGIPPDYDKTVEGWQRLVHPDHRETMSAYFRDEVLGRRRPFEREYKILRADGAMRWVDGRGVLSLGPDGTPTRMRGAIRDITDGKLKEERIREYADRQRLIFERTLRSWVRALAAHERETAGHSERVLATSRRLAAAFGIEGPELETLQHGALLHDIGKIGIPEAVLTKPGPLTEEEWVLIRSHPGRGRAFLESIPGLEAAAEIVYAHHERWDGTGYPRGLAGDDIPFGAQLFSVADVWDALTSPRPYRPRVYTRAEALALIEQESGRIHAPRVVKVFADLVERGVV